MKALRNWFQLFRENCGDFLYALRLMVGGWIMPKAHNMTELQDKLHWTESDLLWSFIQRTAEDTFNRMEDKRLENQPAKSFHPDEFPTQPDRRLLILMTGRGAFSMPETVVWPDSPNGPDWGDHDGIFSEVRPDEFIRATADRSATTTPGQELAMDIKRAMKGQPPERDMIDWLLQLDLTESKSDGTLLIKRLSGENFPHSFSTLSSLVPTLEAFLDRVESRAALLDTEEVMLSIIVEIFDQQLSREEEIWDVPFTFARRVEATRPGTFSSKTVVKLLNHTSST